jgi:DNA helicase IV
MRFPKLTDLDAEQKAIYNGAPPTESILVIGPPGTGKTVMAFHRAAFLQAMSNRRTDKALNPRVIMYSKVLSKYTNSRDSVAKDVESTTMHSWVYGWWRGMHNSNPPTLATDKWRHDWMQILQVAIASQDRSVEKVHWGHLIIDEGQDFPRDMYATLGMVSTQIQCSNGNSPPAITVFADENQRISPEANSTIDEITIALALKQEKVYWLRKNYRNSKQIAEFASHYYVGLPSGKPDVPARMGKSKPRVVIASGIEVIRRRIAAYAANNPGSDIGVLCARDVVRKQVFNSVSSRLSGSPTVVQTYSSKTKALHPPENLQFDKGGSVTVLNFQSAKGLEFDAVFLVDPFIENGNASAQQASMQLYVMASRAREYLELLVMNPPENLAGRLPPGTIYDQIEE